MNPNRRNPFFAILSAPLLFLITIQLQAQEPLVRKLIEDISKNSDKPASPLLNNLDKQKLLDLTQKQSIEKHIVVRSLIELTFHNKKPGDTAYEALRHLIHDRQYPIREYAPLLFKKLGVPKNTKKTRLYLDPKRAGRARDLLLLCKDAAVPYAWELTHHELYQSPLWNQIEYTAEAIGPKAIPVYVAKLKSEDPAERRKAIRLIGGLKSDGHSALENVIKAIEDQDVYVRIFALQTLDKIAGKMTTFTTAMSVMTNENEPEIVRAAAIEIYAKHRSAVSISPILKLMNPDQPELVQAKAFSCIHSTDWPDWKTHQSKILQRVRAELNSARPTIQLGAVKCAAHFGNDKKIASELIAIRARSIDVSKARINTLSQLKPVKHETIDFLIHQLDGAQGNIAAGALRQLGPKAKSASARLKQLLKNHTRHSQLSAISLTLTIVGVDPDSAKFFVGLYFDNLKSSYPETRRRNAARLGLLKLSSKSLPLFQQKVASLGDKESDGEIKKTLNSLLRRANAK